MGEGGKREMGRRKGSKNLTAEEREKRAAERESQPKRARGRPKGSIRHYELPEEVKEVLPAKPPKEKRRKYTVSERVMANARNNATKYARNDEERAYNAKLIDHIMSIHEISTHADRTDLLSLKSCFIAYLKLCQQNGFNVSNISAYASMGMDGPTFAWYSKKDDPEIREFCKFVKESCAMFRENMVAANKLNPVIGIFWQRNYDGLRNDTEQVQAALEQDENYANGSKNYKEKYRNLIGE